MKNTYLFTIILLIGTFIASCGTDNGNSGKNTIVLVDISKSIKSDVLDWYIQTIEEDICKNLTQFDKIQVLPIDGASETASKPLLDINLFEHRNEWDVMGLNANETGKLKKEAFAKFIRTKMQELKLAIADAKIRRKDVGNATDILGALTVAQEKFDIDYSNSIIIMSDMEQYSGNCKMCVNGKASTWLSETADVKINTINKFSVAIITGEQLEMSKQYYSEIKNYWNEFFKVQGVVNFSYQGADASQLKKSILANN